MKKGLPLGLALVAMLAGFCLQATSAAAAPSLGLTATDTGVGGAIQATAQLSEATDPSGTISFEVFGPGDESCAGPALSPAPAAATTSGDGSYPSGTFTPPAAGSYRWSAHYSGEGGE